MKKIIVLGLCILCLFMLCACATADYPGLPDTNNGADEPFKGIEIYCWKTIGGWRCCGLMGTNRLKSDEEIRSAQEVSISQMKGILEKKGLSDCASVILVDLSGDEVTYLMGQEYGAQQALLALQLGIE